MVSKAVGEQIAAARRARGLTQAELGDRLGASGAYVAKVETGRANLTLGQLAAFADALNAGLDVRLPLIERRRVKLRDPRMTTQPR
ncbi:MAG TPA: helix-turn-helix transcriptional regulator [Gaiellaceae bacterium]|nr:helix-turn-helix transcriptional regulator [Gaiellaceae bacterium]